MDLTAQRHRNNVSTPAADAIRITRVFDAPRQLVWDAWTTGLVAVVTG